LRVVVALTVFLRAKGFVGLNALLSEKDQARFCHAVDPVEIVERILLGSGRMQAGGSVMRGRRRALAAGLLQHFKIREIFHGRHRGEGGRVPAKLELKVGQFGTKLVAPIYGIECPVE
jgi:hypothetical protein